MFVATFVVGPAVISIIDANPVVIVDVVIVVIEDSGSGDNDVVFVTVVGMLLSIVVVVADNVVAIFDLPDLPNSSFSPTRLLSSTDIGNISLIQPRTFGWSLQFSL